MMDFLDSIDVDSTKSVDRHTHRKARRVRSWYLYEQYKALEQHQMEATQKLKDRSYQKLLLHEELRERRERRRLLDEFSMSDSGIDRFSNDIHTNFNDSFRSFSDFHNVPLQNINQVGDTDITSLEDSQIYSDRTGDRIDGLVGIDTKYDCAHKHNLMGKKSVTNFSTTHSTYGAENFFNGIGDTNLADDIKENLEYAKKIIAENIHLQLETVKESLQCLEEYTTLSEDNVSAESEVNHKGTSATLLLQDPVEKCHLEHKDASVTSFLQDPAEKFEVDNKEASVMSLLQDPVEKFGVDHKEPRVTTLSQDSVERFKVDHKDTSVMSLLQDSVDKFVTDHNNARVTTPLKDPVEKYVEQKVPNILSLMQDSVQKFDVKHKDTNIATISLNPVEKLNVDHRDVSVITLLQDSMGKHDVYGRNLYSMWSKLVSFSYQVVQLNHGNCYYDYSSQVLTAVLACDVLRRGLQRMCRILQPYVSPINFIAEEDEVPRRQPKRDAVNIEIHRKKSVISSKSKKSIRKKESNKLCSVWKKTSNSPIIFHFCGDCYMERNRCNTNDDTRSPTSSECRRKSINDILHPPTIGCPYNSINDVLQTISVECPYNSNHNMRRPTSNECRRNSINDILRSTSIECRYNSNNDTGRPTSSERPCNSNSDTRRPTSNETWQSLPRISRKESSTQKSTCSLWPDELRPTYSEDDAFNNHTKVTNPMLKLANYMDTFLKDIGGNL